MMGVSIATVVNWEKGKAKPTPALFRSVHDFLGCDPAPVGKTLSERVTVKQRQLGVTLAQMAQYLGGTLVAFAAISTVCRECRRAGKLPWRSSSLPTLQRWVRSNAAAVAGVPERRSSAKGAPWTSPHRQVASSGFPPAAGTELDGLPPRAAMLGMPCHRRR
jgi:hypothetical protein